MKNILIFLIFLLKISSILGQMTSQGIPFPITPVPTVENYFGRSIVDDYRNLENTFYYSLSTHPS